MAQLTRSKDRKVANDDVPEYRLAEVRKVRRMMETKPGKAKAG